MKIVHILKSKKGGAGIAAVRLNEALCRKGADSKILEIDELSFDERSPKASTKKKLNALVASARLKECDAYTTCFSNKKIASNHDIYNADVIHLHWIGSSLDQSTFFNMYPDKKYVWTMHDMNCFTGGCHYSGSCQKYKKLCIGCWQIKSSYLKLLAIVNQQLKRNIYKHKKFNFVAPSKWLFEEAKQSRLLRNENLSCIYNCIDDKCFLGDVAYEDRTFESLGDGLVLMFCADILRNKRKGLSEFLDMLKGADDLKDKIVLRIVGNRLDDLDLNGYRVELIENVNNPYKMAQLYKTSSLFVLPSKEDNLPNTMLEAMLCGTPVAAYNLGGMKDFISDKQDGFLIDPLKTNEMLELIRSLLRNKLNLKKVSKEARKKILANNNYDLIAGKYLDLYKTLTKDSHV